MDWQEVIIRLKGLRKEIERDGEASIIDLETTFALALWDACEALGLAGEKRDEVLYTQIRPVEEKTAAVVQ